MPGLGEQESGYKQEKAGFPGPIFTDENECLAFPDTEFRLESKVPKIPPYRYMSSTGHTP